MPTYEYRCPNGHHFERIAKMSESAAELPCPECGEMASRQISGGAGLVFKGSGFYLTDYGRNAHRAGGGETMAAAEKKSGESKGESKPSESKPSESKGGDAKPAESKPSESKAAESKSSDSKPSSPSTTSSSSSSSSGSSSPKTDK
jgi:putative FmdB family regulatory protein